MEYYINTESEKGGKILGRVKPDTSLHPKDSYTIEVSNKIYNDSLKYNTIHIENKIIEFSNVNYKSESERNKELKDKYKGYYLEVFNEKISPEQLDYDGVDTIKFWADEIGSEYQQEARALLDWYKAIVNKNIEILTKVQKNEKYNESWINIIPSKEEYLAELPAYQG